MWKNGGTLNMGDRPRTTWDIHGVLAGAADGRAGGITEVSGGFISEVSTASFCDMTWLNQKKRTVEEKLVSFELSISSGAD